MSNSSFPSFSAVVVAVLLAVGCGSPTSTAEGADEGAVAADAGDGIRLVSVQDGAAIQNNPPTDLVILDVRTPEEFAEGHLDGAIMIDFYDDDFADQLAGLDPNASYLLYCRSGNRSGKTTEVMQDLGFTDVADLDGGILSWTEAGLPTITG